MKIKSIEFTQGSKTYQHWVGTDGVTDISVVGDDVVVTCRHRLLDSPAAAKQKPKAKPAKKKPVPAVEKAPPAPSAPKPALSVVPMAKSEKKAPKATNGAAHPPDAQP